MGLRMGRKSGKSSYTQIKIVLGSWAKGKAVENSEENDFISDEVRKHGVELRAVSH